MGHGTFIYLYQLLMDTRQLLNIEKYLSCFCFIQQTQFIYWFDEYLREEKCTMDLVMIGRRTIPCQVIPSH
jgi:hypothetical protein